MTQGPVDVLVAEDDTDVREAMLDRLETAGYRAVGVPNGMEALCWLREAESLPPLILLDLMMPIMDGWQFREQQLEDPALAGIPVVVLSAMHDSFHGAVNERISKPLSGKDLIALVARYCGPRGA
jgi:CheY-like chemotaxis protein